MRTKQTKKTGRNTRVFFGYLKQMPGFEAKYLDIIKEGTINDFLENEYGKFHGRELRLSKLSDFEYNRLIKWLKQDVRERVSKEKLLEANVRKDLIHQILKTFTRINVFVTDSFDDVNYHIQRIPYAKGRIIPKIPTDELPGLLNAVRGYCDGIKQQQLKEQQSAIKN